jgi:flagellar export protein FliJ
VKRFKFKLQAVHDLREMQRESAERELAEAGARVAQAEAQLAKIECRLEEAASVYAQSLQSDQVDPFESALHTNFLNSLSQHKSTAREQLERMKSEYDRYRQLAIEAARAVEATDKLRERQRARYKLETQRTEQNMLDEMAMLLSGRRTNL